MPVARHLPVGNLLHGAVDGVEEGLGFVGAAGHCLFSSSFLSSSFVLSFVLYFQIINVSIKTNQKR